MTRTEKLWFGFFPQWILVNGIGWSVAYSLVSTTGFRYAGHIGVYMGAGLFIGFLQWLVLKRHLHMEATWIWVSALAYGSFLLSFRFVSNYSHVQLFFISLIILFVVGLLQRSVLDYHLDYSILWLIVSASAGAMGFIFVSTINNLFFPINSLSIFGALYGIFYGITTGTTLILLFAKTIDKPPF